MRFRFSRQAESDIREISDCIARDNPARAVSFVRELRRHCRQVMEFPEASPVRPALGEVFGPYLIFYVIRREVLEIRRIVHGARDLPTRCSATIQP